MSVLWSKMRLIVATTLSVFSLTWYAVSADFPVVAVFAHPSTSSLPQCGGNCDSVLAAYVEWLGGSGARSLPISFDATPAVMKRVIDNVNGLLLPGGDPSLPHAARWAIDYARELNKGGDFFPIWSTCLGWEWIAQTFAGDYSVLSDGFDAENMTEPFGVLPGAHDSRMLSGFSVDLIEKASTEPLTTNNHRKGVTPEDFSGSGLSEVFRLLAVNSDREGRTYVSAVEAFDWPIYGVQWHPEKSQFEWSLDPDGTPHYVANHTADAVQLSQGLSNFLVSETRRNQHVLTDAVTWEALMFHNREVSKSESFAGSQTYYLHLQGDQDIILGGGVAQMAR